MRAVCYHEHGGEDVLSVDDVPTPEPNGDELLVAVRACSVNPLDVYFRQGETHTMVEPPAIPGSDFAGVVDSVGGDVSGFEPGDRVVGAGLGFDGRGSYAEYAAAPSDRVGMLPEGVSFEQGAAMGHVGVTAWRALVTCGRLEPRDYCLIHGGTGGVGHVAVQLAAIQGARVITTAGSRERRRRALELGATEALDYESPDLEGAIIEVAGTGVDAIVDHRPEDYLELDVSVAAPGARLVLIDGYDIAASNWRATRRKELTIYNTGALSSTPDIGGVLEKLGRLMARGDLTIEIARTYTLEEAVNAQRSLVEDSFVGKLVLVP